MMYEPQPSKMEQMRQSFVKLIRHKQDLELEVIKLLKHPAATGAQIMVARQALLGVEEPLGRAVTALREKYPYLGISYAPRPWHKPEFDRYDQAIMGKTRAHDRTGKEDSTNYEGAETNGI